MSIEPGTKLGQYEVQYLIGQGAMGVVYRAYHVQLERAGAVKILQGIAPDADSTARFRHEAQAIAQMRHPNILNVFDFGEYQGTPYMIMEYVPGGSLAGRMKHGEVEQATTLRYLRGIAAGLDYAHSLGIVHRDVKPANVLLEKDQTPVIADFGLVKLMQGSSMRSLTGVTTGTPAYMAPEQVTGHQVGPAADRYSLATIAYELLTGVIPFDGESVLEILYAHVHSEPQPPSSRVASLGPQVDAVIMRGLAKDPDARWESCEAFVSALEAALASAKAAAFERTVVLAPPVAATIPFTAARAMAPAAMAPPAAVLAPAQAAVMPVARARKSHKVRNVLLALAVIVAVILAAIVGNAAARNQPTIGVSATTVPAGETLVVTAHHLPTKQNGEVQLHSTAVRTYPFQADGTGNVIVEVLVPRDIVLGDHVVAVCWNSSCHIQATIHVTSPLVLSTPSASPTALASPSPKTSPTSGPVISISNYYIKMTTGRETVYGASFPPGSSVTITFVQGSTTNQRVGTSTVSSSGYFSLTFTVPRTAVRGPAAIKVCGNTSCLYATVSVTL